MRLIKKEAPESLFTKQSEEFFVRCQPVAILIIKNTVKTTQTAS